MHNDNDSPCGPDIYNKSTMTVTFRLRPDCQRPEDMVSDTMHDNNKGLPASTEKHSNHHGAHFTPLKRRRTTVVTTSAGLPTKQHRKEQISIQRTVATTKSKAHRHCSATKSSTPTTRGRPSPTPKPCDAVSLRNLKDSAIANAPECRKQPATASLKATTVTDKDGDCQGVLRVMAQPGGLYERWVSMCLLRRRSI
jgi:hypothetical protein